MRRLLLVFCSLLLSAPVAFAEETPDSPSPLAMPPPAKSPEKKVSKERRLDISRAVIERDAEPNVELYHKGNVSLGMAALLQLQTALYVGEQAAVQFQDPADNEGFRVRRARFGFGGHLSKTVSFYLAIDLRDAVLASLGGDQGAEILDAHLVWTPIPSLQLTAGVDKVPLSASILRSSSRLPFNERPLTVDLISPNRRVGASLSGRIPLGSIAAVRYAAGVYNGSDGITSGNRLAGVAFAGRAQIDLLARPRFVPKDFGVSLGAAYMFEDGAALDSHRLGANLEIQFWRTKISAEFLWEKASPDTDPATSPAAGSITRWGALGQATFFAWKRYLEVAVRFEHFADNADLPTFGKQQLFTAGVNAYLLGYNLRLQLNYIRRAELDGPTVANDILFAQLQAMF